MELEPSWYERLQRCAELNVALRFDDDPKIAEEIIAEADQGLAELDFAADAVVLKTFKAHRANALTSLISGRGARNSSGSTRRWPIATTPWRWRTPRPRSSTECSTSSRPRPTSSWLIGRMKIGLNVSVTRLSSINSRCGPSIANECSMSGATLNIAWPRSVTS